MIFAEGALRPDSQLPALLDSLEDKLTDTLAGPPLEAETVISALARLGERLDRGELDGLIAQYAPAGAREWLDEVRWMLRPELLRQKLAIELGDASPARPFGRAERCPLGVLLHVAPGNMEGLPAFTALEGLLTGNINLLKLPRGDRGLTFAVLSLLVETEPALTPFLYAFDVPSGDRDTLKKLAALADGVVTWGGDGAVSAMRELAGPGCKLIEWGHRLGFAYLSGWEGRTGELEALAEHIVTTNGLLCSSCQVIYLDTEDFGEGKRFCNGFLPILERASAVRNAAPGAAAQATLYAYETFLEHIADRDGLDEVMFRGTGCSLTLRRDRALELSPLYGNALVKCLPRSQIIPVLRRARGRLQTVGLLCPPERREELVRLLSRAGVTRITPAGQMSASFPGEGHDGEYPLRRYCRVVDLAL